MKRWKTLVSLVLAGLMLVCPVAGMGEGAPDAAETSMGERAKEMVRQLFDGEYEQIEAIYTPAVKQALADMGGTQAMMQQLTTSVGELKSIGEARVAQMQGATVVAVPVTFAMMTMDAVLSFDADGNLGGLQFRPVVAAAESELPAGLTQTEVTVDAGTGYPVGGTLCAPDDAADAKLPAVLLVSGSGANARDEVVGANRVFAQLAHGLAQRGVISLRFDKRTAIYPEIGGDPDFTVKQEYIEDVLAAVKLLKADERVDASRVFIVGHSEGGMLAPRFVEAGAEVAGLVLMAGTPRQLHEILYDQEMDTVGLRGQTPTKEQAQADPVKQFLAWKAEADALESMSAQEAKAHPALYAGTLPAYYLWDMMQHDPLTLLKEQKTPVLILQGERDMQVYADVDYPMYQQALEGESFAQFKLYPGLSHLFMPSVAQNVREALAEYNNPMRIADEVMDDLARFVRG